MSVDVAEAIRVGREAIAANRPISFAEGSLIRAASFKANRIDRGTLDGIGNELTAQSSSRLGQVRSSATADRLKHQQQLIADREQHWRDLDPLAAYLFAAAAETLNPAFLHLAKLIQRGERGPAPHTFEPEHAPESFR
jgi:hypothetical protein